jgi:hypothetical protein
LGLALPTEGSAMSLDTKLISHGLTVIGLEVKLIVISSPLPACHKVEADETGADSEKRQWRSQA